MSNIYTPAVTPEDTEPSQLTLLLCKFQDYKNVRYENLGKIHLFVFFLRLFPERKEGRKGEAMATSP
jgi:hypothetical protein